MTPSDITGIAITIAGFAALMGFLAWADRRGRKGERS